MCACIECPMIQQEIENRLRAYGYEMIMERPHDKEWIMQHDIVEYCWCDKTGGKIWITGSCENVMLNIFDANGDNIQCIKHKRKSKRERDFAYKRKLRFLASFLDNYPSTVYPVDKNGEYLFEYERENFAYYKRQYRGKRSKYIKHLSNKKVRRYKRGISGKAGYRKIYDYWWELY